MPVLIDSVTPHTPAAKAGIHAGDRLLTINGNVIRDVLDYRFYMIDTTLTVEVERKDKLLSFHIKKAEYGELGLEFTDYLMDRQHHCANKCVFCFVDQLPKGMRETLYFKDDDSRMSFLFGSYVTLTNMSDEDIARIIKMHISPINISVHATDPELRVELMKNPRSGEVLKYIPQLAAHHIRINAQIVICPGLNDGEQLRRSLWDLGEYAPEVQSIALVPVGLTGHREGLYPLEPFTKEDAQQVLATIHKWQEKLFPEYGLHFIHASDEWYILAEEELPQEEQYDGYLQLENGVGMLRLLLDEFAEAMEEDRINGRQARAKHITLATGRLAYRFIKQMAMQMEERYEGLQIDVIAIRNDFFGEMITVSGLLTGQDIMAQLKDRDLGEKLLLPQNVLKSGEPVFLDDYTLDDIEKALQVRIDIVKSSGRDFIEAILSD